MSTPITPLTVAQTAVQQQQANAENYCTRLLIAADIAANVALGGQEDETISTHTALMAQKHEFIGVVMSKFLNLFQADHGAKAAAGDAERAEEETQRLAAAQIINQ
jgi:hypothetical protein